MRAGKKNQRHKSESAGIGVPTVRKTPKQYSFERVATWAAIHPRSSIAILLFVLLGPFLNKAFHVDDPVFLVVAKHLQSHPLAPYDLEYNWFGDPQSMWFVQQNPPLVSYLLAPLTWKGHQVEWIAHSAFGLLAYVLLLAAHAIARRFTQHPLVVVMAFAVTPLFVVSATTVMADIPLLCFWMLALAATLRAADSGRTHWLWLGCLAATAAGFCKYFGIAVVPLILFTWIVRARQFSWNCVAFLLPIAALFLWGEWTRAQSGTNHILGAAQYGQSVGLIAGPVFQRFSDALAFLGGGTLVALAAIPSLRRRGRRSGVALGLLSLLAVALGMQDLGSLDTVFWSIMVVTGSILVFGALAVPKGRWSSAELICSAWLLGTLAFAIFVNWTVSARTVLPALFPALLLVCRHAEHLGAMASTSRWLTRSAIAAALLSWICAFSDMEHANAGRHFAREQLPPIIAKARKETPRDPSVHFIGHWGIQHYLEEAGYRHMRLSGHSVTTGDLFIIAENASGIVPPDFSYSQVLDLKINSKNPIRIMNTWSRGGFYSTVFGRAPWAFSNGHPIDRIHVLRAK